MTDLGDFARLASLERGLCVVSTLRADSTISSSVVNAGVLLHPISGQPVVGFVARGTAKRLGNLRRTPYLSIVVRAGVRWVTAEGTTELIGPDDPFPGVDPERLRLLIREIFTSAGGQHDDWDAFDAVMSLERRVAVLTTPVRCYSNP